MQINGSLDLSGEAIGLKAQNVASDPAVVASDESVMIYNTTQQVYKFNNGSAWVTFKTEISSDSKLITTLGSNWINTDFSFSPTPFNALDNISDLTGGSSLFNVIAKLDEQITTAKTVTTLRGVNLAFSSSSLNSGDVLVYDGSNFVAVPADEFVPETVGLDELSDCGVDSPVQYQTLVHDGNEFTNTKITHTHENLSGTASIFSVAHNLKVTLCNVTIFDMGSGTPVIIDPELVASVVFNSENVLTVTLITNKAVTIKTSIF